MKFLKLFIFTSLISAGLCHAQSSANFPLWLEGTWEINTEFGISYENWTKESDSLLVGKTFRVFDKDTIVFDTMKIKYKSNDIIMEMSAHVKNTRVYAGFVLSQPTPELWKFENPITDSPHTVNYWRIANNRIYVWTKGLTDEQACMDFTMMKVKDE